MSDGKKQGDENWRDATAEDVAEIMKTGKPIPARVRNEDVDSWRDDAFLQGWVNGNWAARGAYWPHCQVYVEPAPMRSPKDGCRMLEANEEPMPGDFSNWGAGWNEMTAAMFPLALIPSWYCRPIEATVESGPPSSIGVTYDVWTDKVSSVVRTDASGKVVEEIGRNAGAEVIEAYSPVVVQPESTPKKYREPTLADLAWGAITCEVRQVSCDNWEKKLLIHIFKEYGFPFVAASQSSIHRWAHCRIEVPIVPDKSDRPVPKGFRLLGDEPRLASDGYWSLSCKDWLVIGDRIEAANRDKWPAIRFVVDEPEPVKQFVIVNDESRDQAMAEVNQTATGNYEFTTRDSQHLRELKIELYRKLLSMPVSILTDNEIDLQLFLSRDSAIQDELKAELDAKGNQC